MRTRYAVIFLCGLLWTSTALAVPPLAIRCSPRAVSRGNDFTVHVDVGSSSDPVADLYGIGFQITFDTAAFTADTVQAGAFLHNGGALEFPSARQQCRHCCLQRDANVSAGRGWFWVGCCIRLCCEHFSCRGSELHLWAGKYRSSRFFRRAHSHGYTGGFYLRWPAVADQSYNLDASQKPVCTRLTRVTRCCQSLPS